MKLRDHLYTKTGWEIIEDNINEEEVITSGSNFLIGNGYLGYRGTLCEWDSSKYTACIVTDTYDMADGKWRELCNVPNGLYTKFEVDDEEVSVFDDDIENYKKELNLRHGILKRESKWVKKENNKVSLETERFASYDNLHLICMKYKINVEKDSTITLYTGIDGNVWSMNGEHFKSYKLTNSDCLFSIQTITTEHEIEIDVVEGIKIASTEIISSDLIKTDKEILRKLTFEVNKDKEIEIEKIVGIYSSNDKDKSFEHAVSDVKAALNCTYEKLKNKHQKVWENIWDKSDISIRGNLKDQLLLRFNLYHSIIATPMHARLPIGARGLSCQAYQGAAFWDQEIFNMPMFLYTKPEIAKNILMYRYDTLEGARKKAKKLGYYGAFYAWISGKTGEELCPSYFFKDVLTGRKIHNHFNDWQIHVSPDIAYAVWKYYEVTGDWEFIKNYGCEIIFEIAQFLVSHAYFKKDKNRYEFIRLLGPDEYHENVNNNAFTNYQSRYALDKAVKIYEKLKDQEPGTLESFMNKLNINDKDVNFWREMVELIYLPKADKETLLIEQFDGYFDLEDISPEKLKTRLKDKGEYLGWPNGIAVETQVIKQADVIQLFCVQDIFDKDILKANYDYYERRTEHGSSLSPSSYSIIASRIGYAEQAYDYFVKSCTIDLLNTNKAVSGGTFIGGIHTASCGASWQMVVNGFAGFRVHGETICFDPHIPKEWDEVSFKLIIKNNPLEVIINRESLTIKSKNNNDDIKLLVKNNKKVLQGGEIYKFSLK